MKITIECQQYGCNRDCKVQVIEIGEEELGERKKLVEHKAEGTDQLMYKCPIMPSRLFNIVTNSNEAMVDEKQRRLDGLEKQYAALVEDNRNHEKQILDEINSLHQALCDGKLVLPVGTDPSKLQTSSSTTAFHITATPTSGAKGRPKGSKNKVKEGAK